MKRIAIALLLVLGCKKVARHVVPVELPPGPPAVLQPADDHTFPTEPNAVAYGIRGGMAGQGEGLAEIWADGTVRFSGGRCYAGAVKSTLPPARVAELLDAIDRTGILDASPRPVKIAPDSFFTELRVEVHGRSVSVTDAAEPRDEYVREAGRLIDKVLGPNPCR